MYDATALSHRDRALLRAVAAGRCQISRDAGAALVVDGLTCCDQLAGRRLTGAGLITAAQRPALTPPTPALPSGAGLAPARLTPAGLALLTPAPAAA